MRFYEYLHYKRRMESGYNTLLKILGRCEPDHPQISGFPSRAHAVKFYTDEYIEARKNLENELETKGKL